MDGDIKFEELRAEIEDDYSDDSLFIVNDKNNFT